MYIYVLEEQDADEVGRPEKSATINAWVPFRKSALNKTKKPTQPWMHALLFLVNRASRSTS